VAETDICELLESLRRSNVDLLGERLDSTATRRTAWVNKSTSTTDNCSQPQQPPSSSSSASLLSHEKCSHLLALRRTLKVVISILLAPVRRMIRCLSLTIAYAFIMRPSHRPHYASCLSVCPVFSSKGQRSRS